MKLKAPISFFIGVAVAALCAVQLVLSRSPVRLSGILIGLFLIILGWKIGWTQYRRFTVLMGHLFLTAGCLVVAYGAYQIPFLDKPPSLAGVLDLPLFWGLFCIFGGFCMITHGHCSCTVKMHDGEAL